ncbi:MAG: PPOX class F420-dependent oxidoreductase [SAR202 cluster bacterium]|nr:PPOX class F420-dependent oxidoreductase [SAR202 cluster bacterium]
MLPDNVVQFATENHQGVLTCFRKNGMPQMSIVTCGAYRDGVAFTTTADRAKLLNLKRDSRCSLMVSKRDWWGYVVLEGKATILSPGSTDADELRLALRDVYRAATNEEHNNWEEYDQAMVDDRRSAVIVVPDRIYGTAV